MFYYILKHNCSLSICTNKKKYCHSSSNIHHIVLSFLQDFVNYNLSIKISLHDIFEIIDHFSYVISNIRVRIFGITIEDTHLLSLFI